MPQVCLTAAADEKRQRLLGFKRVVLQPGESATVTLDVDPRLLGRFDAAAAQWRIAAGTYALGLEHNAQDLRATAEVRLNDRLFGK